MNKLLTDYYEGTLYQITNIYKSRNQILNLINVITIALIFAAFFDILSKYTLLFATIPAFILFTVVIFSTRLKINNLKKEYYFKLFTRCFKEEDFNIDFQLFCKNTGEIANIFLPFSKVSRIRVHSNGTIFLLLTNGGEVEWLQKQNETFLLPFRENNYKTFFKIMKKHFIQFHSESGEYKVYTLITN